MSEALPFDRVLVDGRSLEVGDFLAMPLHARIRFLLDGSLEFFAAGNAVDRTAALRALRAVREVPKTAA